jgi:hypothetical protein
VPTEFRGPSIARARLIEVPKDVNNNTSELNLGDLELLHDWTLSAYSGFGDKNGNEDFWRAEIPRMAIEHPFLMRGILAVSALYLSRIRLAEEKQHHLATAAYY